MTDGIRIQPGSAARVNGVDLQRVVGAAVDMAKNGWPQVPVDDPAYFEMGAKERGLAVMACRLMQRMRSKGYSKEICRDAVWAKVIDEAQRVKTSKGDVA